MERKVTIDPTECSSQICKKITKRFDAAFKRLQYGDYFFSNSGWYVERKTWQDLFASFTTPRLNNQLVKLIDSGDPFVIIIHGKKDALRYPDESKYYLKVRQCEAYLLTLSLSGVPVARASSDKTFLRMLDIVNIFTGKTFETARARTKGVNKIERTLRSIPGIGQDKASKLRTLYRDIPGIVKNLEQIKISPKIKAEIKESLIDDRSH